jgi:hypothetical protein
MGKYPKNRKHSGYAKCNICGKTFIARGMGTHRREAHKMVVKSSTNNSNFNLITAVNDNITVVKDSSVSTTRSLIKEPSLFKPISKHESSKTKDEDLTEHKPHIKTHLYNDTDLWILYGRLRMLLWSQKYPPHIMKERLIQDFEQRFECEFYDVEQTNTHICPDKTFAENPDLASKYASLTYSR